jgi:hypothetical protein
MTWCSMHEEWSGSPMTPAGNSPRKDKSVSNMDSLARMDTQAGIYSVIKLQTIAFKHKDSASTLRTAMRTH